MSDFGLTINPRIFKRLYPKGIPFNDLAKDPFVTDVKKETDFTGELEEVTIDEAGTAKGSPTFSVANANKGTSTQVSFTLRRKRLYEIISLDNDSLMASRDDKGAVVKLLKHATDHATKNFARNTVSMLWSLGGGSLGTIGSISTDTITLAERADAIRFQVGQRLELAEDDGTGAAPAGVQSGTPLVVTAVNYNAGTVTCSANITTSIPAADAGDYIFKEGFYGKAMSGVPGWIPITAPGGSDSFLGINRSQGNVTARSGIRFTASSSNILDKMLEAIGYAHEQGADELDRMCLNSQNFATLQQELRALGQLSLNGSPSAAAVGPGRRLVIAGPQNEIVITGHRWVPKGYTWGLTMDTWCLRSNGAWPHIATVNGQFKDAENADSREMRMAGYGELRCSNPGENMVVTL